MVNLLCLSSWCLGIYVRHFLTMQRIWRQFVIVVFPDHTHYFCNHLAKEEKASCLTVIESLLFAGVYSPF